MRQYLKITLPEGYPRVRPKSQLVTAVLARVIWQFTKAIPLLLLGLSSVRACVTWL